LTLSRLIYDNLNLQIHPRLLIRHDGKDAMQVIARRRSGKIYDAIKPGSGAAGEFLLCWRAQANTPSNSSNEKMCKSPESHLKNHEAL